MPKHCVNQYGYKGKQKRLIPAPYSLELIANLLLRGLYKFTVLSFEECMNVSFLL